MRWGHRPRVPCWCRVCDAWHAASPVPGLHQVLAGPRTPPVIPTRKFHKTKITAGPLSPLPGSPWRPSPQDPRSPFSDHVTTVEQASCVQGPGEDCSGGPCCRLERAGDSDTHRLGAASQLCDSGQSEP